MLPIWPERNAFHVRKPATLLCDLGRLQRHRSHVPRLLLSGWTVATYARGPGEAGRKTGFTLSIDRTFSIWGWRSEEHTSELQSLTNLVFRLLLEQKKTNDVVLLTAVKCTV